MIKKTKIYIGILGLLVVAFVFSTSNNALAYKIETVPVEARNDFVLEPGKVEVFLEPGETVTRNIYVTSRVKKTIKFKIETEDFVGSNEPDKSVVLLGKDKSPYSFKDAILPEVREFSLGFGQKATIPVKIKIPQNAQPGGFYSAVIISNQPEQEKGGTNVGGAINVSRLGALFFIRVKGEVKEEGQLDDFRIAGPSKMFYEKGPISFNVLFNNKGTVHLVPYGRITIANFGGSTVGVVPIDGYFSLPKSLRYREVTWYSDFLFGRYKATVELNRGYKNGVDVVDTQSIAFWVLPWKFLVALFAIIFVITSVFFYIRKNFEFRKK